MKITFEERTASNEDDATIYHCIWWKKDGFIKGELSVEHDTMPNSTIEFFGKTLLEFKIAVYQGIMEDCDYEYKTIEWYEKTL